MGNHCCFDFSKKKLDLFWRYEGNGTEAHLMVDWAATAAPDVAPLSTVMAKLNHSYLFLLHAMHHQKISLCQTALSHQKINLPAKQHSHPLSPVKCWYPFQVLTCHPFNDLLSTPSRDISPIQWSVIHSMQCHHPHYAVTCQLVNGQLTS